VFKGIAFDLDGTLIEWTNSWDVIRNRLGLSSEYKRLIRTMGYREAKLLELEHWKERGVTESEIGRVVGDFELRVGVKELMPELKKRYAIALITGAPNVVAEKVGESLGLSEIYCNRILFDEEGRVKNFVLEVDEDNKGDRLREFAEKHRIRTGEVIAVGDAGNDVSMFRVAGLSIATNPKSPGAARAAKVIVNGEFGSVYDAITKMTETERTGKQQIL
jgi:phosphoserine phosphatase